MSATKRDRIVLDAILVLMGGFWFLSIETYGRTIGIVMGFIAALTIIAGEYLLFKPKITKMGESKLVV